MQLGQRTSPVPTLLKLTRCQSAFVGELSTYLWTMPLDDTASGASDVDYRNFLGMLGSQHVLQHIVYKTCSALGHV